MRLLPTLTAVKDKMACSVLPAAERRHNMGQRHARGSPGRDDRRARKATALVLKALAQAGVTTRSSR